MTESDGRGRSRKLVAGTGQDARIIEKEAGDGGSGASGAGRGGCVDKHRLVDTGRRVHTVQRAFEALEVSDGGSQHEARVSDSRADSVVGSHDPGLLKQQEDRSQHVRDDWLHCRQDCLGFKCVGRVQWDRNR